MKIHNHASGAISIRVLRPLHSSVASPPKPPLRKTAVRLSLELPPPCWPLAGRNRFVIAVLFRKPGWVASIDGFGSKSLRLGGLMPFGGYQGFPEKPIGVTVLNASLLTKHIDSSFVSNIIFISKIFY